MKLVVDASPLILLNAVDQLQILAGISTNLVIPAAVVSELEAGSEKDRAAEAVRQLPEADLVEVRAKPSVQAWSMGAGETSVLSHAQSMPGFTCVLDDRAARRCARALAVPTIGTLGLVLAAEEFGLIPSARVVLEEMQARGFYLSTRLLELSNRASRDDG